MDAAVSDRHPVPAPWMRLLVRAVVIVVAFPIALWLWPAMAAPTGAVQGLLRPPPADAVLRAIGPTLSLVVVTMVVATVIGVGLGAIGWLAGGAAREQPALGVALSWAGRIAQLPWVAVPVAAFAVLLVVRFGIGSLVVPLLVIVGLPAALIAAAATDGPRLAGVQGVAATAGAVIVAVGRGVAAVASVAFVAEVVTGWPGVGRLIVQAESNFAEATLWPFLVLAFLGHALALGGDALETAFTRGAPEGGLPADPPSERSGLLVDLVLLGLPAVLLLLSVVTAAVAGSGVTRSIGRPSFPELMVALEASLLTGIGAGILAVVLGGAWGALANVLETGKGAGAKVAAEAVLAPAWILVLAPLIVGADALWYSGRRWPFWVVLGFLLLPRVAIGVRDLGLSQRPQAALRGLAGMLLMAVGVAVVVGVSVDVVGVGSRPTQPTLGTVIAAGSQTFVTGDVTTAALLTAACVAPLLFAGWSLLRPLRRAQAWALLEA